MIIKYANKHRWVKTIHPDILPDFGKNGSKKISQLLTRVDEKNISHVFAPLSEDFFAWFKPLYDDQIAKKGNPNRHDIIGSTLYREDKKRSYFSLSVFENNTPVGGAIFTFRKNRMSIVYRAFKNTWPDSEDIRCSPALLAEYLLSKHALENNLPRLVHGRDRNPYGINAAIGLATFKLSVGCHPEIQKDHTICEFNTDNYTVDTLILEYPEESFHIKNAFLITTAENLSKYEQLMSYESVLKIKTVLL